MSHESEIIQAVLDLQDVIRAHQYNMKQFEGAYRQGEMTKQDYIDVLKIGSDVICYSVLGDVQNLKRSAKTFDELILSLKVNAEIMSKKENQ
jgi:hypothetical protein